MEIAMRTYEAIDPGMYPATIAEIKPETGKFGDQLKVKFLLEDQDATTLTAWTSTSFSPKSRLFGLTRAAFGGSDFPPGFVLNTDKLIGRRLMLMVTVKPKGDGSGDFNKVEEFLPLKPHRAAMATPAAQPAARPATNGSQRPTDATTEEPPDLWPDEAPAWLLSEAGDDTVPF